MFRVPFGVIVYREHQTAFYLVRNSSPKKVEVWLLLRYSLAFLSLLLCLGVFHDLRLVIHGGTWLVLVVIVQLAMESALLSRFVQFRSAERCLVVKVARVRLACPSFEPSSHTSTNYSWEIVPCSYVPCAKNALLITHLIDSAEDIRLFLFRAT